MVCTNFFFVGASSNAPRIDIQQNSGSNLGVLPRRSDVPRFVMQNCVFAYGGNDIFRIQSKAWTTKQYLPFSRRSTVEAYGAILHLIFRAICPCLSTCPQSLWRYANRHLFIWKPRSAEFQDFDTPLSVVVFDKETAGTPLNENLDMRAFFALSLMHLFWHMWRVQI